jgi:Secretion system C-terminal sorting domain
MKAVFVLTICLLAVGPIIAQQIKLINELTSNGGGSFTSINHYHVQWAFGECVVNNFSSARISSEQGFLHSEDIYSSKKRVSLKQLGIKIFPNPSDGVIQVRFNNEDRERMIYYLFDVSGRTITTSYLLQDQNEINFGRIRKGTYFLRFINPSGLFSDEKLIIL